MRQEYPVASLQEIVSHYNVGTIRRAQLFTSGFENSNYYIETDTGEFVVKIFEGEAMDADIVQYETEAMHQSFVSGVRTPEVIRNNQESLITKWHEKCAAITRYVPGTNAEKQTISDALALEIGEQTGKMDTALKTFTDSARTRQEYAFDGKTYLQLEEKMKYLPEEMRTSTLVGTFDWFRSVQSTFNTLPTGLIHNDVVLHNILVNDGKLAAIVDFSDMAVSPYIQNVAVSMAQLIFTYNWQPAQAKLFIDGYRTHNPLSDVELSLLYGLTLCRYGICIIELHYWDTVHGTDPQRVQFIRDNHRFLERFSEIGSDTFKTLIGLP